MVCCSYRAIKLLEQSMKGSEMVLERRVCDQGTIDNMKFGFMPGKRTIDKGGGHIKITIFVQPLHRSY